MHNLGLGSAVKLSDANVSRMNISIAAAGGAPAVNEKDQRQSQVSQATHSALLEGLMVSSAFQRDSDDYVAGTISADELVELTRERFGLAARG